jgi:hypothetical protein
MNEEITEVRSESTFLPLLDVTEAQTESVGKLPRRDANVKTRRLSP